MARSERRSRTCDQTVLSKAALERELAQAGLAGTPDEIRDLLDALRDLAPPCGASGAARLGAVIRRLRAVADGCGPAPHSDCDTYRLLSAVTEGITDAVFVKDREGRYLMINSAGAAHTGQTVEQVLGRDDSAFFAPETARRIREEDRRVMEDGVPHTYENVGTGGGVTRAYLATKVPYRDADGRVIGVMGISREITDRKRAEQELRVAKEAAESANRAKDQFLAILSHELRTPLTPVLASVTYVESKPDLPQDLRREIAMIRRNIEMEARLIDDLLDLTRISRGKVELRFEALDAHCALRRALEICQADVGAKRLEFSLGLWAERHCVWADPARMQQVFWNLINNAVKFTPAGGRVSLRTSNDAEGLLEIQVTDTGVGIQPDVLPRIFDAFEQGERNKARRFGGLGLGLAVSKALADMHGAELVAASEGPDRGSTFTLRINTIHNLCPTKSPERPPAPKPAVPALRILLVEDHEDTLAIMASLLRMFGHTVTTAGSVGQALELGGREPFDLLISDIALPDGSGLDVVRRLGARPGLRAIALSGYGMEEDRRQSREAGFDRHLTKPIDFETLERTIAEVIA